MMPIVSKAQVMCGQFNQNALFDNCEGWLNCLRSPALLIEEAVRTSILNGNGNITLSTVSARDIGAANRYCVWRPWMHRSKWSAMSKQN